MTERKREGKRNNSDAGAGARLARLIRTPKPEYEKALEMGITYPAAGLPDYEALFDSFGLFPGMLSPTDFTRLANGTQRGRNKPR